MIGGLSSQESGRPAIASPPFRAMPRIFQSSSDRQTCPRAAATVAPGLAIERRERCHRAALCPFKCTEPAFDCPYPRTFPLNERE